MAGEPAWKKFERKVAALVGGKRFWANSGEELDAEGPEFVVQCKNVKKMSLAELTELAISVNEQGKAKGKFGIVAVKLRDGAGNPTPILIVMTSDEFGKISGKE